MPATPPHPLAGGGVEGEGGRQVRGDPRSTWGAWTNGKTDRREWEERRRESRPKDWEAGRRRKGETWVLRQLGRGPLAAAHWGWPQGEGVTRTPFGQ